MQVDQFYQSRQAEWKQLSALLDRCQSDIGQLSPDDVESLGRLYRATTSDLALAQRDFPRHRVTAYLNQLVARGHAIIYRSEPLARRRVVRYVTAGFPQVFRETGWFTLTAALMFILPAVISGLVVYLQPAAATFLLPEAAQQLIPIIEDKELWTNIPIDERPYASSFIMTNNIRVSFFAFSSGVLGGIVTLWIMLFNGLLLGGITGLTAHHGVGFELWTFVIGHGVVELSVIFIAGGSGLMLGWSVLRPGLNRRIDSLVIAARKAVKLIVGCVPLLVLAGIIEGFISPAEAIPWPVKWSVGIGTGLIMYAYLLFAGRGRAKAAYALSAQDSD